MGMKKLRVTLHMRLQPVYMYLFTKLMNNSLGRAAVRTGTTGSLAPTVIWQRVRRTRPKDNIVFPLRPGILV